MSPDDRLNVTLLVMLRVITAIGAIFSILAMITFAMNGAMNYAYHYPRSEVVFDLLFLAWSTVAFCTCSLAYGVATVCDTYLDQQRHTE